MASNLTVAGWMLHATNRIDHHPKRVMASCLLIINVQPRMIPELDDDRDSPILTGLVAASALDSQSTDSLKSL